jgi:cytoskeletal protein CcmA (bactofilin family)
MFSKKKQPPIRSLIAQGSEIKGHVRFTDGLRIDGIVHGDIRCNEDTPSLLVISETAHVIGEIHADHVIANGHIEGPVYANELLELQPKAKLQGDVHYRALEMHPGATIAGQMFPMSPGEMGAEGKPQLKLAASNG